MNLYPSFLDNLKSMDGFRYIQKHEDGFYVFFKYDIYIAKIIFNSQDKHPLHELFTTHDKTSPPIPIPDWLADKLRIIFKEAYQSLFTRDKLRNALQKRYQCDKCNEKIFFSNVIFATKFNYYKPIFEFCSHRCLEDFEKHFNVELQIF